MNILQSNYKMQMHIGTECNCRESRCRVYIVLNYILCKYCNIIQRKYMMSSTLFYRDFALSVVISIFVYHLSDINGMEDIYILLSNYVQSTPPKNYMTHRHDWGHLWRVKVISMIVILLMFWFIILIWSIKWSYIYYIAML